MPVKPTVIVFFFNLQWVLVVSGKIKFHDGRDENDWLRTTGRFRIVLVVKSIWSAWIDYEPRRKPNGNLIHRDRGEWTTVRAVRRLATWNSRWKVEKNDNTHEVFFFFGDCRARPRRKRRLFCVCFKSIFDRPLRNDIARLLLMAWHTLPPDLIYHLTQKRFVIIPSVRIVLSFP